MNVNNKDGICIFLQNPNTCYRKVILVTYLFLHNMFICLLRIIMNDLVYFTEVISSENLNINISIISILLSFYNDTVFKSVLLKTVLLL